jgi:integrase
MPRPKKSIPTLCIDKSRNRAFCKVDGRFVVLGPAGSAEAQAAYGKLVADLARKDVAAAIGAVKRRQAVPRDTKPAVTLNELFLRYVTERMPTYSTEERKCLQTIIREARKLFGETSVADFGPLRLQVVRDAMIERGWSRSYINHQVKRLRRIFRWGVSKELVPVEIVAALATVESLKYGEAPGESRERRALSEDQIQAVRGHLIERWRDPFDVMLLCGCRPGELLKLTTGGVDRSGEIWRAELKQHKNSHRGKSRTLFFNATAQLILRKYLSADPAAKLFPMRLDSFSKAVRTACEVAFGMPKELRKPAKELTNAQKASAREWRREHTWTPHWLRHTVATRIADELGTEAAQRLAGHATRAMAEHYSRAAERQAVEAVKRLG